MPPGRTRAWDAPRTSRLAVGASLPCVALGASRLRRRAPRGPRASFGDAHAHVALAVGGRAHAGARVPGRCQPQGRLADAQQRARGETDRAGAEARAVQRRAVRGAEVGDRDAAVLRDRDRAVQPGDVRVVQRDVGVGGAADA